MLSGTGLRHTRRNPLPTIPVAGVSAAADTDTPWDKTFAKKHKVIHEKVSHPDRYGLTISVDLYLPKNMDQSPFGCVNLVQ